MLLDIENMSHSFGDKIIYENVNIKINDGEKIGLVGTNGSGKSTLINLLNGNLLCDSGSIKWLGKHKVGYLDQYATIEQNQTIYNYLLTAFSDLVDIENKYNEINNKIASASSEDEMMKLAEQSSKLYDILDKNNYYAIPNEINKVASGLGIGSIGMDNLISNISGGQRAKVMLVKLLLEKPDLLILDEPTNFLDSNHIEWLTKYLNDYTGTFLIVSHDTVFLNNIVNVIWSVESNNIVRYTGNYNDYLRQRQEKDILLQKTFDSQTKVIAKLQDYIDRNIARASTAKMAHSREKQLEKIELVKLDEKPPEPHFKFDYKSIQSKIILRVTDLIIGYDKPLLPPINLLIQNGEKWLIKGFNGIGKSTFLKTICGIIPSLGGNFELCDNLLIGYYEQDLNFNEPDKTAINDVCNEYPRVDPRLIRTYLSKCGLSAKHLMQPIESLSGGEQSKIKICKIMLKKCNFLILDEPTNHLDVASKNSLAKAINEFKGTVIFVSHEADFIQKIDCKVLDIESLKF
jgi:ATPase subunit of ABC transporter with duplicated ATPase domains